LAEFQHILSSINSALRISLAYEMKASLFCTARYMGAAPHDIWPLSGEYYSSDAAVQSMQTTFDQFRCADEFGFDWVTVAEHHYSAFSLSPNPMVMAGALSQIARRARIAVLGPTLPILNPVRVAEELAMIDTMSGGQVIAGMMRGTPNEYLTYNINPAESRERFAEPLHLIRRAWTEMRPFGWLARYYQYRTISIWPRPVRQPHPPLYMSGVSSDREGGGTSCQAPTRRTRPGLIAPIAAMIDGTSGLRSCMRLDRARTTTMPKGRALICCWNSMPRSIVTRTSYWPLMRSKSSPFLIPAQPREATVSTG
jgi:hypothetical protein